MCQLYKMFVSLSYNKRIITALRFSDSWIGVSPFGKGLLCNSFFYLILYWMNFQSMHFIVLCIYFIFYDFEG